MAKKDRKLRIGMLKAMPGKWDVEGNWAVFEQEFKRHRGDDLDVLITPECFLDGYAVTEKNWGIIYLTILNAAPALWRGHLQPLARMHSRHTCGAHFQLVFREADPLRHQVCHLRLRACRRYSFSSPSIYSFPWLAKREKAP